MSSDSAQLPEDGFCRATDLCPPSSRAGESGAKAELLSTLASPSFIEKTFPRATLELGEHPGGPSSLKELRTFLAGRGVDLSELKDHHLLVAVDRVNAQRLHKNIALRENDRPLVPLIALDTPTRLLNVIELHPGGRTNYEELAQAIGVDKYVLYHAKGLDLWAVVDAANQRRVEANVERRSRGLPLVPLVLPTGDSRWNLIEALEQAPGGRTWMGELAAPAGMSMTHFDRVKKAKLDWDGEVTAANQRRQRANELRRVHTPPLSPVPRLAFDNEVAVKQALEDYPMERMTAERVATLTHLPVQTVTKSHTDLLTTHNAALKRTSKATATAGLEEREWLAPIKTWVTFPQFIEVLERQGAFNGVVYLGPSEDAATDRYLVVARRCDQDPRPGANLPEVAAIVSIEPTLWHPGGTLAQPDTLIAGVWSLAQFVQHRSLALDVLRNDATVASTLVFPRRDHRLDIARFQQEGPAIVDGMVSAIAAGHRPTTPFTASGRLQAMLTTGLEEWTPQFKPIELVAQQLGLLQGEVEVHGEVLKFNAEHVLERLRNQPIGELVPILGITSDGEGEGKTTTTISLLEALYLLNIQAAGDLRQPSEGPAHGGEKGGAIGYGHMQLYPGDLINTGLTGDFVTIERLVVSILQEFFNNLDRRKPGWPDELADRIVLPMAIDKQIRQWRRMIVDLGVKKREKDDPDRRTAELTGVLTPASEPMGILTFAQHERDFLDRLGRMIVAYFPDGTPLRVRDIRPQPVDASGRVLMDDLRDEVRIRKLLWPNLVRTLYGHPVGMLSGPFANTAPGTSAWLNTMALLHLVGRGGIVAKEFGFSVVEGGQKAFDNFFPTAGLTPRAAVVVATIRALKFHGHGDLSEGLANLDHHLRVVKAYGVEPVVAINRHDKDADEDIQLIRAHVRETFPGVRVAVNTAPLVGPEGALELAQAVMQTLREQREREARRGGPLYRPLLTASQTIEEKLDVLARQVYGADGVAPLDPEVAADIEQLRRAGRDHDPIIVSKTQKSVSESPGLRGLPTGWQLHVDRITPMDGAGYLLVEVGETPVERLPGLGSKEHPEARPFKPQVVPPGLPKMPAGLEEQVHQRWQQLVEGRTGRGVVVVTAEVLERTPDLVRVLGTMPEELASDVVLWGNTGTIERLQEQNPALEKIWNRDDLSEAAHYLSRLLNERQATQMGVIGDATAARRLQAAVNSFQKQEGKADIIVTPIEQATLALILQILGIPESVTQQVGLEELLGDLYTRSGT